MLGELFRTGRTNFKGTYFSYDDVAFHSGTEMAALRPLQTPPPTWIVSNPRLVGDKPTEQMRAIMERACNRIIRLGDGWMTCCRAEHPEERFLTAVVPTFETHVNTPLTHRDPFNIRDVAGTPDVVDLTFGATFIAWQRSMLSVAYVNPVTGPRPFSGELLVQLNIRF